MITIEIDGSIRSGIEALTEANTDTLKNSVNKAGQLIRFRTACGKNTYNELSLFCHKTEWSLHHLIEQYKRNKPTDIIKWKKNIKEDIRVSYMFGYPMGVLAPRWKRKRLRAFVSKIKDYQAIEYIRDILNRESYPESEIGKKFLELQKKLYLKKTKKQLKPTFRDMCIKRKI